MHGFRLTSFSPLAHERLYSAALELLDMILAEWREDAQLASVYHHRAECFLGLGDVARGVDAYRQVQTQRVCKSQLTMAHLDFGWLVVTAPLPDLYDEALAVLGEFTHEMFPIDRYRASAIHALILDARGQLEQARVTRALRFRRQRRDIQAFVITQHLV